MSWRDLLAYWQSKHVGDIPPARADIDPISEIPKIVRSLMLIDCLADGYRYRLIGSELAARIGRDVTGRMAAQGGSFDPGLAQSWLGALDIAVRMKEPQLLRSELEGGGSVLTLLLPLVSSHGTTEMLIGGCFPEGATEGFWRPLSLERIDLGNPGDPAPFNDHGQGASVVHLRR